MKPMLHFRIPEYMMRDPESIRRCTSVVKRMKTKFSCKYNVIITLWSLESKGNISFDITPKTDVPEFIRKLETYVKLGLKENSNQPPIYSNEYTENESQKNDINAFYINSFYIEPAEARKAVILIKKEVGGV